MEIINTPLLTKVTIGERACSYKELSNYTLDMVVEEETTSTFKKCDQNGHGHGRTPPIYFHEGYKFWKFWSHKKQCKTSPNIILRREIGLLHTGKSEVKC